MGNVEGGVRRNARKRAGEFRSLEMEEKLHVLRDSCPATKKRARWREMLILLISLATTSYSQDVPLRFPWLQLVHVTQDFGAKLNVYNPELITNETIFGVHFNCTTAPYQHQSIPLIEQPGINKWHAASVADSIIEPSIQFSVLYNDEGYLKCRLVRWNEISSNTLLVRMPSQSTVVYTAVKAPNHVLEIAIGDYYNRTNGSSGIIRYFVPEDGPARVTFNFTETEEGAWLQGVLKLRDYLYVNNGLDVQYRSTRFCYAVENGIYKWPKTPVNRSSSALPLCLLSDGTLARIRRCLGDILVGAYWEELREERLECQEDTNRMRNLKNVSEAMDENDGLEKLAEAAKQGNATLNVVEVSYISEGLRHFSKTNKPGDGSPRSYSLSSLADIVDSVLKSDSKVVRMANSALGTSPAILASVDELVTGAASPPTAHSFVSRERVAVFTAGVDHDVKGFVAYGNWSSNSDLRMDALSQTNWTSSIRSNATPSLAAMLLDYPEKVALASIIYRNTSLYGKPGRGKKLLGSVIGLEFVKENGDKVKGKVTVLILFARGNESNSTDPQCAYWNTDSEQWSLDGCYLAQFNFIPSNTYGCLCTHLTHFGMLISYHEHKNVEHDENLTMVTIVGCSLSLFCLFLTFLYVALVPQWRRNVYRKIELHLFASVVLLDLTILVINALELDLERESGNTCVAWGVLTHYSVLATFTWMLVVAALQYLRLSPGTILDARRRAGTHLLLKSSVFAWGVPFIPVIATLGAGPNLYERRPDTALCYPKGIPLYLGVMLPVALSVLLNAAVFSCIMRTLFCTRSISSSRRDTWKPELVRRIFYSLFLFCLLGLSWIPGLFLQIGQASDLWNTVFGYVFCVAATLHGVSLFVFLVACEKGSWPMLRKEISKHAARLSSRMATAKKLPHSILTKSQATHDVSTSLPTTSVLDNVSSSGRYISSSGQ